MVDHVDGIIGARIPRAVGAASAGAHAAGDQHGAVRQQIGDLRERVGLARQEKRKRRFRPDQMRDVAHAGCLRTGRAIREREIARHHALLGAVIELLILLQVRLHDAQLHAVDEAMSELRDSRSVPYIASAASVDERKTERQRNAACVSDASSAMHGGRGENRDRQKCQAPQPDQRRGSAPAPAVRSAHSRKRSREIRSAHDRAAIRRR